MQSTDAALKRGMLEKKLFAENNPDVLSLLKPLNLHGDAHDPVVTFGSASGFEDH